MSATIYRIAPHPLRPGGFALYLDRATSDGPQT
jgi:hypothetical protein